MFRWVCRQHGLSSGECVGRVVCLQVSVSAGWSVFGWVCRQGGLSSGECVSRVVCLQVGVSAGWSVFATCSTVVRLTMHLWRKGIKPCALYSFYIVKLYPCPNWALFPMGKCSPFPSRKATCDSQSRYTHSKHRFPAPFSKLCQI